MDPTIIILGAAGFLIATLFGGIGWMIKDRLALRQRHESELASVREIANKEHLEQIEVRLGFGSEKMGQLASGLEIIKEQLQNDRIELATAVQSFQTSLVKLCDNFVSKSTCKEHRQEQGCEFEEIRKAISGLTGLHHDLALKLENMAAYSRAHADSMKDLTLKLVNALDLTADRK